MSASGDPFAPLWAAVTAFLAKPGAFVWPSHELLPTPPLKASGRPVEDGDRLRAALRPTCNGCVAAIVVVGLAWESFYVLGAMPTAARGAA